MDINDTMKAIHRLAVLRDDLSGASTTSIVIGPEAIDHVHAGEAADATRRWHAQTYRGKGQWGTIAGAGRTPGEALTFLLGGLVSAHRAVDSRREAALKVAAFVPSDTCQCPPKPFFSPGSMAAGSATEDAAHDRWEAAHGHHANAAAARLPSP